MFRGETTCRASWWTGSRLAASMVLSLWGVALGGCSTEAPSGSASGGGSGAVPVPDASAPTSSSSGSGGAPTDAAVSDAPTGPAPGCAHFHPGHYFREVDSATRSINGVGNIAFDLSAQGPDVTDFTGIVLQIDWAMLEPTRGTYDFTRVDQVMALARSKGKHVRLKIMDRSFWASCNPPVALLPPYVQQVSAGVGCFADVWTPSTMDGYIALHIAAAKRYDADPAFAGFNTEEIVMAVPNGVALTPAVYAQRVRLANELFAAVPQALLISEFNWPLNNDVSKFNAMVDATVVRGTGGAKNAMGISWPDTWLNPSAYTASELTTVLPHIECTVSATTNGKTPCSWYNLGRTYQHQSIVAPNLEGGVLTGTRAEAEALYNALDKDIGAHMITWDTWTGAEPDYLRKVAVPTIRSHGAKLTNTACPFTGH